MLATNNPLTIAFIDSDDSFSWNIIDALKTPSNNVIRLSCHIPFPVLEKTLQKAHRCVLGPGPSTPQRAGNLMKILPWWKETQRPLLGICLGHQAIGLFYGIGLQKALRPVHGQIINLWHDKSGLYHGIPSPMKATGYHSLVLDRAHNAKNIIHTAYDDEGQIMGLRTKDKLWESIQLHLESFGSQPYGYHILQRWAQ